MKGLFFWIKKKHLNYPNSRNVHEMPALKIFHQYFNILRPFFPSFFLPRTAMHDYVCTFRIFYMHFEWYCCMCTHNILINLSENSTFNLEYDNWEKGNGGLGTLIKIAIKSNEMNAISFRPCSNLRERGRGRGKGVIVDRNHSILATICKILIRICALVWHTDEYQIFCHWYDEIWWHFIKLFEYDI